MSPRLHPAERVTSDRLPPVFPQVSEGAAHPAAAYRAGPTRNCGQLTGGRCHRVHVACTGVPASPLSFVPRRSGTPAQPPRHVLCPGPRSNPAPNLPDIRTTIANSVTAHIGTTFTRFTSPSRSSTAVQCHNSVLGSPTTASLTGRVLPIPSPRVDGSLVASTSLRKVEGAVGPFEDRREVV